MDLKEIRQIVELMNEHGLSLFHLEKKDFNIKLKKAVDLDAVREALGSLPMLSGPAPAAPASPALAGAAPAPAPEEPADEGLVVASPMVGTFYRKSAPDAGDFVKVGDSVSEGQVLCIIEAMKVMNEIKAEFSGTVTEICIEDATPVQYGDTLFRMK